MTILLGRLLSDLTLPKDAAGIRVTGVALDSRLVKPGDVFFAIPGSAADGAKFIVDAVAKGAVAVVGVPGVSASVPVIHAPNPRRELALAAARFFEVQPRVIAAVTGTNGKTSVAAFTREIWSAMGFRAASLGTVGIVGPQSETALAHTTPDAVTLHEALEGMVKDHVSHLAIEASSHGLVQNRLDGLRLTAGAFTNITRDHLDYHETPEAYFEAKMRLFDELLPQSAGAVINADLPIAEEVEKRARAKGLNVFTVGRKGAALKLAGLRQEGFGQHLTIETPAFTRQVYLPLAGEFQASNALVAAGLVIACGGEPQVAIWALEKLKGAKGRLDLATRTKAGAPVFVDYAHTPDAIETALAALRPYVSGKLVIVFGCGGDRDKGKRPLMGAAARKSADIVYVTDDNPRSEDPAQIRREIMAAAPGAIEIGDREIAIHEAVAGLGAGDVLLLAGKGHETGQIIGNQVRPFSDHDVAKAAAGELVNG
jgi:UDP-N-acetylmuramoyl-L-alanyl-D-glutamate--2,6-diaminopimelate ligase